MINYPDGIVFSSEGPMADMPSIRKVFLMGNTQSKIIQHECLYEGKAGFEKLKDHAILCQITVNENEPRKNGDTHKDIEHTPTGLPIDFLLPREIIMQSHKLWRFMGRNKFDDIINRNQLYFSRLDGFSDNLEGTAPGSSIQAILNDPQKNDEQKSESLRLFKIRMENNRKNSFACCWHNNESINYDMWDEYGGNSIESIAIQTNVSKLEKALKECGLTILCEPVRYFDEPYFNQSVYWFPTLFKRSSFCYEQEFRSILFAFGVEMKGMRIKINPQNLISKIFVHPKASKEYFKEVRNLLKEKGLKIPVAQLRPKSR